MPRRHIWICRKLPIAIDVNLTDNFKFVRMQEYQFAARAEKIYITPVKLMVRRLVKETSKPKPTAAG